MEKIVINEFGLLKNLELDFKDFILLTGQNVRGKTTLAKVIYFLKSFRTELFNFLNRALWTKNSDLSISSFNRTMRSNFLKLFGPTYGYSNIEIHYYFSTDYHITISLKDKYVDFNFHDVFKEEIFDRFVVEIKKFFKSLPQMKKQQQDVNIIELKKEFSNQLRKDINQVFDSEQEIFYFPFNRNTLPSLSMINISEEEFEKTNYLLYLLNKEVEALKHKLSYSIDVLEQKLSELKELSEDFMQILLKARELLTKLLKGKLIVDKSGEKLYYNQQSYVRLNFAASSQQSLIWLLHILYVKLIEKKPIMVIIEEPEMFLTPEEQKNIVEFLALIYNVLDADMVITTHSPYLLFALSNLFYAYSIGKEATDEVSAIIDKNLWLDPQKLLAYEFTTEQINEIFDNEIFLGYEFIENYANVFNKDYKELFKLT